MRKLLIAAASLAALPSAAAAQPVDPRAEDLARALPAPQEMEAIGAVLGNAVDALMDVPVGPLLGSIDPEARYRAGGDTLGALAADDDPYFRERVQDEIAGIGIDLGMMSERFAALAPVLIDTLDDVQRRVDDAIDDVPERDWRR